MSLIGKSVPNKKLTCTTEPVNCRQLKGNHVILYFYPRDNTPGCTNEAIDFNNAWQQFQQHECIVLGVSRDSLQSHEKFKAKHNLNFDLISDEDETLCQFFDVIKEKNMYGKKVLGIERSTFYIDPNGKIQHEWRKIKVPGHVDDVLNFLAETG